MKESMIRWTWESESNLNPCLTTYYLCDLGKVVYILHAQVLFSKMEIIIYDIELWWGFHEMMHVKHLVWSLAHDEELNK